VVGEALEGNPLPRGVGEEAGERRPVGDEQRDVEEAGVAVRGRRASLLDEAEERGVGSERRPVVL
jgi:hypothetical protein